MFIVMHSDSEPTILHDAKGYRVNKETGLLTVWGRHFQTIAAYPKGTWEYVSEKAPEQ
ncbi:MAG: hypothetical protein ABF747_02345 [Bifidobacterium sp.]|uniref:Uncharacterized protein n=1 Tax=Bifidobacterium fermentum TaxID=3059035 RepID=A0AB39UH52_9BIFI